MRGSHYVEKTIAMPGKMTEVDGHDPAADQPLKSRSRAVMGGAIVRCYFVKDATIVADKQLPDLSLAEAVQAARKILQEGALYDGIEVWSHTRRICRLGAEASKPPLSPLPASPLILASAKAA